MEKNGSVILSTDEVQAIRNGTVPAHVKARWDLTLEELQTIIEASIYIPAETHNTIAQNEEGPPWDE